MLGFTGGLQWPAFANSLEANDGAADPLDRWSRRVIGDLACEYDGVAFFPSGEPRLPFQRLAMRGESVHASPIGLLIHRSWGLWHAYRGALVLPERLAVPAITPSVAPCATCATKPCLSACPVGAFSSSGFDIGACTAHIESPAGTDCLNLGCRARRACPIGTASTYGADQARFHQRAFLAAIRRRS